MKITNSYLLIRNHSFFKIKHSILIFFCLFFIGFIIPNHIHGQEINTTSKPDWVKENILSFDFIDQLKYPQSVSKYNKVYVYKEIQINVDQEESFVKTIFKLPNLTDNHYDIDLTHSSMEDERKIISFSIKKKNNEIDITKNLNWNERETKEYVYNRLWDAYKTITLSIDKVKKEDYYSLSFLDKNIRDDYNVKEAIWYFIRDSIQVNFRLISSQPLFYKTFNGFPEVKEKRHDTYYEYIAQGYATTPYHGKTPYHFISDPFICFSLYQELEEVGVSFSKQLQVDQQSTELLNNLYTQLSQNETNDSAIVKNIVNYVQDTMVYQDYGLYRSYQPYWCIQGNRGDCKSKSYIAIELFKRAGIKAYPVLVRYPSYLPQLDSIPSLYNFNHVIVQFIFNKDTILMDPTSSGQMDKIGGYFIPNYNKSLVIYDDEVKCIEIPYTNRGKVEIHDEITDRIKRKLVLNGEIARKYKNFNGTSSQAETVYDDNYFRIGVDNYAIHHLGNHYFDDNEKTDLDKQFYNSVSQDSIVLYQEMYYPDSVKNSFIPSTKSTFRRGRISHSFSDREVKDSLYTGLWPLNYINQSTTAKYYKNEIPLATIDLDTFETNFALEPEFGFYKCTIEEDDVSIIVKQDIYVSGGLPIERLNEYDIFEEKMEEHQREVRNLILRKKQEEVSLKNSIINFFEKKKNEIIQN